MTEKHKCPVCGKYMFEERDSMDFCEVCGWFDDVLYEMNPNYRGGRSKLSLNEARKAYEEGRPLWD